MTSEQLAKELGISRALLFKIRSQHSPGEYPDNFSDVAAWRGFMARAKTGIRTTTPLPELKKSNLPSAIESNVIFVAARAKEKVAAAEILEIELAATKRAIVREEEIIALFAKLSVVLRGRLMKMAADLPNMLLGLDAPGIDKVVREKLEEVLSTLVLPKDLFDPRGIV
jgi:ribosomal protein L29